ncbi:hypothetical protein [Kitasatospora sp. NPDC088783]|uniref:hypothetical protein n=1 Tax=Kitasatospora sp. NPDC088783 TaxID=3364077 RepID=UPI0037F72CD2
MRYTGEPSAGDDVPEEDEDARGRAWEIAERLARAGGGEARLTGTGSCYRVELRLNGPAPDEYGVLEALALGDRWGHRYSSLARNGGVARETVWSEVRRVRPASPPPGRG